MNFWHVQLHIMDKISNKEIKSIPKVKKNSLNIPLPTQQQPSKIQAVQYALNDVLVSNGVMECNENIHIDKYIYCK